jgi:DNA-binding transcriptional MocR family regulator
MKKPAESMVSSLGRDKLPELVAEKIKRLIFSNKVEAGQKLPTVRKLTKQFKISRSMVREGLTSLVHSALVEIPRGPSGDRRFYRYSRSLLSTYAESCRKYRLDFRQGHCTTYFGKCEVIEPSEKQAESCKDVWQNRLEV